MSTRKIRDALNSSRPTPSLDAWFKATQVGEAVLANRIGGLGLLSAILAIAGCGASAGLASSSPSSQPSSVATPAETLPALTPSASSHPTVGTMHVEIAGAQTVTLNGSIGVNVSGQYNCGPDNGGWAALADVPLTGSSDNSSGSPTVLVTTYTGPGTYPLGRDNFFLVQAWNGIKAEFFSDSGTVTIDRGSEHAVLNSTGHLSAGGVITITADVTCP